MRIGSLKEEVTWQYQTRISDGMGGFTEVWVDAYTTWAAMWPLSAREIVQAGKPELEISHRIVIRYKRGFKADWRGKYGNRYFNIISIINKEESNEFLTLLCKEVV